jgi:nucleotide-binding universal stress UspA family protein
MQSPHRILVPTDFSARSDGALDYAIGLAQKLGAELIVLHACEMPPMGYLDPGAFVTVTSTITDSAKSALDSRVAKCADSGVPVRAVLKDTTPCDSILACIAEYKADLVIMATHGRRGLPRAVLGSVTEEIVRTAACPVLTVRDQNAEVAVAHSAAS